MSLNPIIRQSPHPIRMNLYALNRTFVTSRNAMIIARSIWRIYHYPDGGAGVECNGEIFNPSVNQLLIIPPNTGIRHTLDYPCWHLWLHVGLGHPYDTVSDRIFYHDIDPVTQQLLDRVYAGHSTGLPYSLQVSTFVTHLISSLPEETWSTQAIDPRIERVLEEIDNQPGRQVENRRLAKIAGMSCNAFIRLFRESVGKPPRAYILERRLEDACRMLVYSNRTLEDVADDCGFGDRSYLSRVFTKKLGMPPARYRRENQPTVN